MDLLSCTLCSCFPCCKKKPVPKVYPKDVELSFRRSGAAEMSDLARFEQLRQREFKQELLLQLKKDDYAEDSIVVMPSTSQQYNKQTKKVHFSAVGQLGGLFTSDKVQKEVFLIETRRELNLCNESDGGLWYTHCDYKRFQHEYIGEEEVDDRVEIAVVEPAKGLIK